jgi:hypothetical protein
VVPRRREEPRAGQKLLERDASNPRICVCQAKARQSAGFFGLLSRQLEIIERLGEFRAPADTRLEEVAELRLDRRLFSHGSER